MSIDILGGLTIELGLGIENEEMGLGIKNKNLGCGLKVESGD